MPKSIRASSRPSSLLIRIDPAVRGGLQRQICAGIRKAILEGLLPPGTPVPSSRALAEDLDVSRTTSLLALEQLLAEGYLTARRGSGTFVAHELPDDLPCGRQARGASGTRHPPLSRRGAALVPAARGGRRLPGPPRPFRVGTPAVDRFPLATWARLASRRLRSATPADLDYGDPAGLPALRQAIAEHVQSARGTACGADQIVVVAGAQQGLDLVCRVLLDAGDRVGMEDPGYPGARSAFVAAGAQITPVPIGPQGLEIRRRPRRQGEPRMVYVTPSHQYPLGVPMSLGRRLALLQWAHEARAWVVEDDYDSEFRYGARPLPCLHGLDSDGRVLYIGSFSKTLFPALRLGFLIVPADLHGEFVAARAVTDQHPPTLDQATLADFIAEGHFASHLRRMRAVYRERLEALGEAAARFCGGALVLRPAHTGLHAIADLVTADADAGRVAAEAAARGIEATPLAAYFPPRARVPAALVLGFGSVPPRALARGMERLAEAIAAARR